jgi:hypothetical protein
MKGLQEPARRERRQGELSEGPPSGVGITTAARA